jgi:hypothetical protein
MNSYLNSVGVPKASPLFSIIRCCYTDLSYPAADDSVM